MMGERQTKPIANSSNDASITQLPYKGNDASIIKKKERKYIEKNTNKNGQLKKRIRDDTY